MAAALSFSNITKRRPCIGNWLVNLPHQWPLSRIAVIIVKWSQIQMMFQTRTGSTHQQYRVSRLSLYLELEGRVLALSRYTSRPTKGQIRCKCRVDSTWSAKYWSKGTVWGPPPGQLRALVLQLQVSKETSPSLVLTCPEESMLVTVTRLGIESSWVSAAYARQELKRKHYSLSLRFHLQRPGPLVSRSVWWRIAAGRLSC